MSEPPDEFRVLHVDDEPGLAETVATFLEREDDRLDVLTATSPEDGYAILADHQIDCVVSDYDMPRSNGIEFLENIREQYADLSFILYTGKGSEEVASDAISAGVTDYLQKERGTDQYTILANRVVNAVERYRIEREADQTRKQFQAISENSKDAIVIIDSDSRIRFTNQAIAEYFGYSPEELQGESLTTIIPERHRESHLAAIERFGETGERTLDWSNVQFPGLHRDGAEIPLSISFSTFTQNGDQRFVGIMRDISEGKKHERRLKQIINRMNEAVIEVNAEWEITLVNERSVEFSGVSKSELLGRNFWSVFTAALGTRFEETYREVMRTREPTSLEGYYSGVDEWFDIQVYPNDDGGIAFYFEAITEHKKRQQELLRAHELLDQAERIADVGGWEIDAETLDVFWTDHLYDILGMEGTEEPPLDAALDIYHEDDRPIVEDAIETALETGEPFDVEVRFWKTSDTIRWLRVQGEPTTSDGEVVTIRGAVQDITERKGYEKRLEALHHATRQLISAETRAEVLEIGVGTTRDILDLKANAIHLYDEGRAGLRPVAVTDAVRELVGEPPTLTSDDSIAWRVYEEGEPLALDDVHEDSDLHNPDTPIRSELYLPIGTAGIMIVGSTEPAAFDQQDILLGEILAGGIATALEQIESTEELRKRERELTHQNDRLEQFASIVSHDLRNPLTIAEGRLELAKEEGAEYSDHLDDVERAHDRMKKLIEDLLTLAREGDAVAEPEDVDVAAKAEQCWRNVETANASLVVDFDGTIRADESRLQQVFENLVRNAIEHAGDDVTVTVGRLDAGFYIEDDGPGISAEAREHIFDAGYSTRDGGTGFGLNIVKQIVDAHGWDISVTEGSEGGSRFEITNVEFVED